MTPPYNIDRYHESMQTLVDALPLIADCIQQAEACRSEWKMTAALGDALDALEKALES